MHAHPARLMALQSVDLIAMPTSPTGVRSGEADDPLQMAPGPTFTVAPTRGLPSLRPVRPPKRLRCSLQLTDARGDVLHVSDVTRTRDHVRAGELSPPDC